MSISDKHKQRSNERPNLSKAFHSHNGTKIFYKNTLTNHHSMKELSKQQTFVGTNNCSTSSNLFWRVITKMYLAVILYFLSDFACIDCNILKASVGEQRQLIWASQDKPKGTILCGERTPSGWQKVQKNPTSSEDYMNIWEKWLLGVFGLYYRTETCHAHSRVKVTFGQI